MKKTKTLLMIMLALVLCFGVAPAGTTPMPEVFADESYIPDAAITKILEAPVGTILPVPMEFELNITPVEYDNAAYDGTNMPSFNDITLNYSSDLLTPSANANTAGITNPQTTGDTVFYVLESGNIFDGLQGTWQGAGVYKYTIKEKADTFTINDDPAADFAEDMTWSGAEYTLYIYVFENSTGNFYIDGIGVTKDKNDDGDDLSDEKLPAVTKGGDDNQYFWSQIEFRNRYWKTYTGDADNPDPDDSSLTVSKKITGDAIVAGDYDRYFTFNMTVDPPSVIPTSGLPAYYFAYVVDGNGDIVVDLSANADPTDIDVINGGTEYIKFIPGTETTFNLRHGEKLIFLDIPVGTAFKMTEAATPYYLPSYQITTAGMAGSIITGHTSQSLTTDTAYTDEGRGLLNNLAAFTNTCDSTPQTGLTGSPFYGLGLLAFVAFAIYIAIKSRKRENSFSKN